MISLFTSAQKDNSIDFEEEAKRARIQDVIDRAIEVPETVITDEMRGFFAAKEASEKSEAKVDPWEVVKEFVRGELSEHAA